MYGFTLNRKRPGHFNLCFLANKNSTVQTWVSSLSPRFCWSVCSRDTARSSCSRGLLPFRCSRSRSSRVMRCIQSQASTRVSEFRSGSCRWEDTFWGRHAHTCKTRRRDPRTHVRSSSGTNTQSLCRRTNTFYSRKRSLHLWTTPSARSIWISTSGTWSFSWTTTADASEYEPYSSYCLGWPNLVFIVLYSYFSYFNS